MARNLSNDPNAALFEKFGKEQVNAGFPLLYEVVTVRLDSILDAMVRNFVKHHAAKRPIVKRPKEKRYEERYGVDRHERELESRGYGGSVAQEVRRALIGLSATRDVIVHQLGRADDRFVRCCPWLHLKTGDAVRINNPKFVSYLLAARLGPTTQGLGPPESQVSI